jgi:excisionase family DNA binding protein
MPNAAARNRRSSLATETGLRIPISNTDRKVPERLYCELRLGRPRLVAAREVRPLPDSLNSFLIELIGLLNEGEFVMIVRNEAKLTTIEAASILGVSRQFLVNLLEKGEVSYHMVGTHRRIYAQDKAQFGAAIPRAYPKRLFSSRAACRTRRTRTIPLGSWG